MCEDRLVEAMAAAIDRPDDPCLVGYRDGDCIGVDGEINLRDLVRAFEAERGKIKGE